jgi:hypothetical protein
MLLALLVSLGNLTGAALVASPLYRSIGGVYGILVFEVLLLGASVAFLSMDFSIASTVIVLALLYVAFLKARASPA